MNYKWEYKDSMKRLNWIDVSKGICILAVIIGHMGNTNVNKIVFPFHLVCFFILSGYTLKEKKLNREYVSNKFKRLMIPYFITCLFIILMDIFNIMVKNHNYTIYSISTILKTDLIRTFFASGSISNFVNINLNVRIGAIWFFPAMFFSLIISKIIIQKYEKYFTRFMLAITTAIIGIILSNFIWLPFSLQSAMLACPFIIFGKYIKDQNVIDKIRIEHLIIFFIIFILGYKENKTFMDFVTASMPDKIITPIVSLASSMIVIKLSQTIEKSRFLRYVGENSLYFICVHLFLLETSGFYINKIYTVLNIEPKYYLNFLVHVIICLIVTVIINLLKKIISNRKNVYTLDNGRNLTIDVLRTICIIAMIFGHCSIDSELRKFIFSFHMMAFILLSGYLYKDSSDNIIKRIWKEIKRLIIPTSIFTILFVLFNHLGLVNEMKTLMLEMSFSNKIFINVKSIGPYYFVLLLFMVKIIYISINKIIKIIELKTKRNIKMTYICMVLTLLGVYLGKKGYWLPWSVDIALYSLGFFHIGYLFKKYDLINKLMERKYLYFILSPIWVFMIYSGSMEIAIRKYEPFGLVILGSISGILVMYIFSNSISNRIGKIGNKITSLISSSTIYILIIHTVFNGKIVNGLNNLGLNSRNIFNLLISVSIQICGGVIIFSLIKLLNSQLGKFNLKIKTNKGSM